MGGFLRCSQGYDRSSVTDARQTKGGTGGLDLSPVAHKTRSQSAARTMLMGVPLARAL
jgi:hypothetical protein